MFFVFTQCAIGCIELKTYLAVRAFNILLHTVFLPLTDSTDKHNDDDELRTAFFVLSVQRAQSNSSFRRSLVMLRETHFSCSPLDAVQLVPRRSLYN